jgi:hypothetical protein
MSEPVHKSDNTGSVRKDLVPVLEGPIGSHNDGTVFIATVDDLIEEVCGVVVIG